MNYSIILFQIILFLLSVLIFSSCTNAFGESANDIAYRAHAQEKGNNWCEALKLYTEARKESGKEGAYQKQIDRTKEKCDAEKKKKKEARKKRKEAKRKKDAGKKRKKEEAAKKKREEEAAEQKQKEEEAAKKKREEEATEQKRKEEEARKKPIEVISKDGAVIDLVPAGEFTMGYDKGKYDEKFEHTVYLDDYYIDRYEVTVAQYRKCVEAKNCKEDDFEDYGKDGWKKYCNYGQADRDSHPMNCVSWRGLKDYCEWSGKRLPTEAEWEKAARGTDKRLYPWGNKPEPSCDYTVMDYVGYGCGKYSTFEVGSKPKGVGPYGTHDLVGNVCEWCSDWYCDDYYSKSPKKNPKGCKKTNYKVLRGGSWSLGVVRGSFRFGDSPVLGSFSNGGRCARD